MAVVSGMFEVGVLDVGMFEVGVLDVGVFGIDGGILVAVSEELQPGNTKVVTAALPIIMPAHFKNSLLRNSLIALLGVFS